MSRIRLVLLSMLAVLALGAAASASASAQRFFGPTCSKEDAGSEPPVKYDTIACNSKTKPLPEREFQFKEIASGTKVKGTSTVSTLSATISGSTLTIECETDKFKGTLGTKGASSGTTIEYKKCKVTGAFASTCTVPGTLTTNTLKDQLSSSGRIEDTFEPETTGGTFIEIPVTGGSCSIEHTYPIKGKQTCEVDSTNAEAETLAATHKLICKTSGSALKLGSNAATYEGNATIELEGGGNWATE